MAVCNAVERVCGVRPGIKWPNDVILDGRKLCGILTELELEAETAALRHVVVGVGINLTQTAADFGPEVAPVAVSLAQALGRAPRRAEMAAAVLAALDEAAKNHTGVCTLDGSMVDKPMELRARTTLAKAAAAGIKIGGVQE